MDAAKSHIDGDWRDVKVGLVHTVEADADGVDRLKESAYAAAREPAESFGWRMYARARGWRQADYAQTVVYGDGADWIWQQAALHFPDAVQILDFMHASEHIWKLSRALYGEGSPKGTRWAQDRVRSLRLEGAGPLLRALRRRKPATAEGREALRLDLRYFASNRGRMQYPRYRAQGMLIGSGPVEAGCKVVVGKRLKQAGMRWSDAGADSILALRTALLSGETQHIHAMALAA